MKKMFRKEFVQRLAMIICGIVIVSAPLISQDCLVLWYQPEEPEGLKEYARRGRNNK